MEHTLFLLHQRHAASIGTYHQARNHRETSLRGCTSEVSRFAKPFSISCNFSEPDDEQLLKGLFDNCDFLDFDSVDPSAVIHDEPPDIAKSPEKEDRHISMEDEDIAHGGESAKAPDPLGDLPTRENFNANIRQHVAFCDFFVNIEIP